MDLFRLVNRFNIRENLAAVKKAGAGRLSMAMRGEQKTLPRMNADRKRLPKLPKSPKLKRQNRALIACIELRQP